MHQKMFQFLLVFVQNTVHTNKYLWQFRQHSQCSHLATGRMNYGLNPDREKNVLLQTNKTGSAVHSASYSIGTVEPFPGSEIASV